MGANDQAFIDSFVAHLSNRQGDLTESLPSDIEWTGNKRNMLVMTSDIRPDEHDDFFDAYIATLCEAFKTYVVDGDSAIATTLMPMTRNLLLPHSAESKITSILPLFLNPGYDSSD